MARSFRLRPPPSQCHQDSLSPSFQCTRQQFHMDAKAVWERNDPENRWERPCRFHRPTLAIAVLLLRASLRILSGDGDWVRERTLPSDTGSHGCRQFSTSYSSRLDTTPKSYAAQGRDPSASLLQHCTQELEHATGLRREAVASRTVSHQPNGLPRLTC